MNISFDEKEVMDRSTSYDKKEAELQKRDRYRLSQLADDIYSDPEYYSQWDKEFVLNNNARIAPLTKNQRISLDGLWEKHLKR